MVTPAGRPQQSDNVVITMAGEEIPTVQSSTHLGIQRFSQYKDTVLDTVNENIKKARRTVYSLLSTCLHGENGLDPQTSLHIMKIFVLPVLLYGQEIILPTTK